MKWLSSPSLSLCSLLVLGQVLYHHNDKLKGTEVTEEWFLRKMVHTGR